MKKILFSFWAMALIGLMTLSSCSTKMTAINQLENLTADLRDNSAYYRVEDWKDAGEKFMSIRKKMSKYDYTPAERRKIGELEGQCAKYMVTGVKDGLLNSVFGIASEINGILDAIKH
jgi:hypothetical protein